MKKNDFILISILLFIGIVSLISFKLYENINATGDSYAKVFYQDELILMIDLHSYEYIVYQTQFQDLIDTGRASEGVFYVPGSVTTDMQALYEVDEYAKNNQIIGIKLLVYEGSIEVVYQESPKDVCELQGATSSSLNPLVCLPNEIVVKVFTNLTSNEFIPDSVLE